jgi:adenosylmethionine-8-amino-7-oxononanoate aminotransferase
MTDNIDYAELSRLDLEFLWHPLAQHKAYEKIPPRIITSGEGCYVTDSLGNRLLDGVSGLWCVNVGYGRKELAQAAYDQMCELPYYSLVMSHAPAIRLAAKLVSLFQKPSHVFFSNSGSEANEAAFKIARQYHWQKGASGRTKILSRARAYHGSSLGALSATGQTERRLRYEPMLPGFVQFAAPYCYRCPFGKSAGSCNLECAQDLETTIVEEGAETVAAVVVEPVVAGGGLIVSPEGYLKRVREICDKHGVLLMFDEVVNGLGRLGRMFGHEHWGVKPDILTIAKGTASGYLPLSATIVQNFIFNAFMDEPGTLSHFRHINTFGGHPACCAVGLKNIEIIERENLVRNAAVMGDYLAQEMQSLLDLPAAGDVRFKGLLAGVELVENKRDKTPLAAHKVGAVVNDCLQQGVIVGRNTNTVPGLSNVIIVAPPYIVEKSDIDRIVAALRSALAKLS